MSAKKRIGIYDHFCLLILAQRNWKENDREKIRKISLSRRKEVRDYDYHFYHKLTHRKEEPTYSDCLLCKQIYRLLIESTDNRGYLLYQGHHPLWPENFQDLLEFVQILLAEDLIKKVYLLSLDSLKEFKTTQINSFSFQDLKNLIVEKRTNINEFKKLIVERKFQHRIMYEILKNHYY